jgi:hypothetical protein
MFVSCDGPISRPRKSYRVCMCIDECDQVQNLQCDGATGIRPNASVLAEIIRKTQDTNIKHTKNNDTYVGLVNITYLLGVSVKCGMW